MVKIIIWKISVYATLNNNECQILILMFVFYFLIIIHVAFFVRFSSILHLNADMGGLALLEDFAELPGKSLNCQW